MAMLNQSGFKMDKQKQYVNRIPRLSKNNSNKELSKDKRKNQRWSHKKTISISNNNNSNTMKRSMSTFMNNQLAKQNQIYRIQKTFLIDYILKGEERDQKIFAAFQNQLQLQLQLINQKVMTIKMNDKETEYFVKSLKQSYNILQNKNKQYKEIIKIQQLIIEEFNRQGLQYHTLFQIIQNSLNQIYDTNDDNNKDFYKSRLLQTTQTIINSGNIFQHFTDSMHLTEENISRKIKHHKNFIKDKIGHMENQNKQLKRILDDMIKLIKTNKKLQVGSYGSIRTSKNSEEFTMPQSYKSSSFVRK